MMLTNINSAVVQNCFNSQNLGVPLKISGKETRNIVVESHVEGSSAKFDIASDIRKQVKITGVK